MSEQLITAEQAQIIEDRWCNLCAACDGGLPAGCTCAPEDHRPVILDLTRTVIALHARLEAAEAERDDAVKDALAFRPAWSSPFARPERWNAEPNPTPRRYVSTHQAQQDYADSIRCSSDWPAEKRHAALDSALHRIPDLCYEIQYLRDDLETAEARERRVRALTRWRIADGDVSTLARALVVALDRTGPADGMTGPFALDGESNQPQPKSVVHCDYIPDYTAHDWLGQYAENGWHELRCPGWFDGEVKP